MTSFGAVVARELRSAIVPIETVSIVDFKYLEDATRALLKNALFYVVPTPDIDAARAHALKQAACLADTIRDVGVHPQGISLDVDQARADALVAFEALIDAVSDAKPTPAAIYLGIA